MADLLSQSKPKARKVHRCDYCSGEIGIGEIYINSTIVNDQIYTWKSHTKCQAIAEKLEMFDTAEDGLTFDMFCENIVEEYACLIEHLHMDSEQQPKEVSFHEKLQYLCEYFLKYEPIEVH